MPPSPDKLFRLDPVETKITAPLSQFQALAEAADQSLVNRSLGRGFAAFSQALGRAAEFTKNEQIREDIKTAKDAAVRGEVMPNVLPVAEKHYQNVVDINTAADSLNEAKRYFDGSEFDQLVQNTGMQSSQKTTGIESIVDDFYARAASTMQNPETIQKLRLSMNILKEKGYTSVYEAESDQRSIQGGKAVASTIKDNIAFSKKLGVSMFDSFPPSWVKAMTKQLGDSHPNIPENERRLIIMQQLMANPDIVANPDLVFGDGQTKGLIDSEYNKGFSFRNLAFGKGDDAKEYAEMQADFLKRSKELGIARVKEEKALKIENQSKTLEVINDTFIDAASAEGYSKVLVDSGFFDEGEAIKLENAMTKYINRNVKAQRYSEEWYELIDTILDQKVTLKSDVQNLIISGGLRSDLLDDAMVYVGEEGKQKLAFTTKYTDQINTISTNVMSLLKLNLRQKDKQLLQDHMNGKIKLTNAQMIDVYKSTGMDEEQYMLVINRVNDLQTGMKKFAEELGERDSIADRGDGSVSQDNLQAFNNIMEQNVQALVAEVKEGVLPEVNGGITDTNFQLPEGAVGLTATKYSKIIPQEGNIFDREESDVGKLNITSTAEVSSDFQGDIFSAYSLPYKQTTNLSLKSMILDGVNGYPENLSTMVAQMAANENDFEANPTAQQLAIRNHAKQMEPINKFFENIPENLSHIPGFIAEILDPTMKDGKKLERVDETEEGQKAVKEHKEQEEQKFQGQEAEKRSLLESSMENFGNVLDSIFNMFSTSEAEGSQVEDRGEIEGEFGPEVGSFLSELEEKNSDKSKTEGGDILTPFKDQDGLAIGAGINKDVFKQITGRELTKDTKISRFEADEIRDEAIRTIFKPALARIEEEADVEFKGTAITAMLSLLFNVGEAQFKFKHKKRKPAKDKQGNKIPTNAITALKNRDLAKFIEETFGKKGFNSGKLLVSRRQKELKLLRSGRVVFN